MKEKKNLEMTTYTNYGFEYIYKTISIESTKEFSNDLKVFMYHVGCTLFTHESGKKSCFYQSVKKFAYSKIIWKHLVNRNKPKRLRVFLNFFSDLLTILWLLLVETSQRLRFRGCQSSKTVPNCNRENDLILVLTPNWNTESNLIFIKPCMNDDFRKVNSFK